MKLIIAVLGAKGMPNPGGIESVMEEVCTRLVSKGHQVDVFVRRHYMKNDTSNNYRGLGLVFSRGIHSKNLDTITHSLTALLRILSGKYNVVYFNSVGLSTLSWIPRLVGKKTVVHTHGLDWKREKWGMIAKKLLRLSAYSTVFSPNITLCVSREDKRFLENTYKKECIYMPNGSPRPVFSKPDEIRKYGLNEKDYCLFMSRLVPEKGCHFLLEAWKKLSSSRRTDMKLVIAGDTHHRDRYYYDLLENKDMQGVIFTGFATGKLKTELLSNAYCFVQPSTIEGLSVSILEALNYGLYVIASDINENKDALQGCGMTFQCGNADDLRDKMEKVLGLNSEEIKTEGRKARDLVKREYDWDHITDRLESVLMNL